MHTFGNVQTENGYDKLAMLPQVTAVLEQRQYIDRCFVVKTRFGRDIHLMSLELSSKEQAQLARQRIIEEHNGVDGPPFVVMYASTKFVLRKAEE